MRLEVLSPHGFCAGVRGALEKVAGLRDVYCLHALVHNEQVVADLTSRGFRFVDSVEAVPLGATVVFSAHGVTPAVRAAALARGLKIVDATCPFVARVHAAARAFASRGLPVVVIGDAHHAEVTGILGEIPPALAFVYPNLPPGAQHFAVVSQTTMNSDEVAAIVARLKAQYEVESTAEVCTATKRRQDAVKAFSGDLLLVLGSPTSANTQRLAEVATCPVCRIRSLADIEAIRPQLEKASCVGLTSGASTPESFLDSVLSHLAKFAEI